MRAAFHLSVLFLFSSTFSFAQDALKPRTSPLTIVTAHYKNTYLKITYSQPQKRGREIFGKTVPYDQVWRTGANEATELTVTNDILINGTALKGDRKSTRLNSSH